MAQSYEIYIRDKTSGQKKPTEPKANGNSNTAPKIANSQAGGNESVAETGLTKAAAGSNAGKVLLAIYAAGKIVKGAVDIITPFVTRESGDYRFSVQWNNSWQVLGNMLNPLAYQHKRATYYQETKLYNERQEQQRLLVGDAYINSISRKS